ncbi:lipid A biosynthesis lauroyl acyltransferase [Acetobacter cibinongensis]|uniref:Lipid A biosynthesis (Lauroyl) acyltransferase n=1 Tax=Acetobacter cibinongensis TaxID=146475 RepID=A0A0D6N5G4_9PROT|nr:lipid A biosynthesis (lauroyl) acyltransferase [Acetobacter cibinongensis]GEL57882.1 lipid A biosynthesis lauroyl acyltransferase [Acetobacter cibinongensis]
MTQSLVKWPMRVEAFAAKKLLGFFKRLGPVKASNLGGRFCRTAGPLLPVSKTADRNLQIALPHLTRLQRRAIVKGVWENLGRTVGELPHLANLQENTPSGPGFEVQGADYLRDQVEQGGPVLFLSGHIGNWEMLPPAVARHGAPFASFYRAAANPLIDAMIRRLRDDAMAPTPMPLFAKGARGAREALSYVAKGGRLGMLVDQKMNDGVEATFFGLPAMTAPALAAMALKYRCTVIPGHVERLGPARLRIIVEPPLILPQTGNKQQDMARLVQMVNDQLEVWIRQKPESWLWLHKRWPKSFYKSDQ